MRALLWQMPACLSGIDKQIEGEAGKQADAVIRHLVQSLFSAATAPHIDKPIRSIFQICKREREVTLKNIVPPKRLRESRRADILD